MRLSKIEILPVIVMIVVVACSSCMFLPIRRYAIGFRNMTYQKFVYDAGKIGSYHFNFGTIGPPDKKIFRWSYGTSMDHIGPIPETVTIKWKKYNDEPIDYSNPVQGAGVMIQKVKVRANLPKGFRNGDEIIFNFTEKNKIVLSFMMKKYKYEVDSKGERVFYNCTDDILKAKNLPDNFKKYIDAKRKHNAEKQSAIKVINKTNKSNTNKQLDKNKPEKE